MFSLTQKTLQPKLFAVFLAMIGIQKNTPVCAQGNQQLFTVTFGPSGNAKSSSINTISQEKLVEVGDGSGYSTTTKIRRFKIDLSDVKLHILDVPGLRDNKMIISDDQITQDIFENMADYNGENAYVLLYHSLDNPNTDIKETLALLKVILGENITKSVLVILTKQNMVPYKKLLEKKIEARKAECEQLGLKYMLFDTEFEHFKLNQYQIQEQNKKLISNLQQLEPFQPSLLKQYKEHVKQKAIELYAKGPKSEHCHDRIVRVGTTSQGMEGMLGGASIGAATGGPLGALIGLIAGGLIGNGNKHDEYITQKDCSQVPSLPLEHYQNEAKRELLLEYKRSMLNKKQDP